MHCDCSNGYCGGRFALYDLKVVRTEVGCSVLSYIQMSNININPIQSIAAKHEPTLQLIHNHAIARSHKVARQVYNRQSRNIAQFIREQLLFNKKMAHKPFALGSKSLPKRKRFGVTLRYEEDQVLELSFDRSTVRQEDDSTVVKAQNTVSQRDSRQEGFLSQKKSFLKSGNLSTLKLQHKHSTNPNHRNLSIPVHSRKKTLTLCSPKGINFNCESPKKSSVRRRVATQFEPVQQAMQQISREKTSQSQTYVPANQIIVMTRQKMNRFIKSLHRLAWMADGLRGKSDQAEQLQQFRQHLKRFRFDPDSPIPEQKLNYMVARRYGLLSFYLQDHYGQKSKQLQEHQSTVKKQTLASHKDFSLLEIASKQSILDIIHKNIEERPVKAKQIYHQARDVSQLKISFSLPFAEFISERETKASIYRLVRMAPASYLKIAFSLYDKNQNGIIDEDDLVQAIALSRKLPQLQPDLLLLCGSLASPRALRNRQKTISQRERTQQAKMALDLVQPIRESRLQSSALSQEEPAHMANSAFSLDKFYVFLTESTGQQNRDSLALKAPNISVSLAAFSKLFLHRRPAILVDLFQFLFSAQKEDFTDNEDIVAVRPSGRVEILQSNREETLQEKWNSRIKNTNAIVKKLLFDSRNL